MISLSSRATFVLTKVGLNLCLSTQLSFVHPSGLLFELMDTVSVFQGVYTLAGLMTARAENFWVFVRACVLFFLSTKAISAHPMVANGLFPNTPIVPYRLPIRPGANNRSFDLGPYPLWHNGSPVWVFRSIFPELFNLLLDTGLDVLANGLSSLGGSGSPLLQGL